MLPAAQDEAPQNSKAFGSHRTPEAFFITAPDLWMSDPELRDACSLKQGQFRQYLYQSRDLI